MVANTYRVQSSIFLNLTQTLFLPFLLIQKSSEPQLKNLNKYRTMKFVICYTTSLISLTTLCNASQLLLIFAC